MTYNPLLPALIEYTSASAPDLRRIVNRSQVEAVSRIAARVPVPDWSDVTYWLVLVSWRVPALGT